MSYFGDWRASLHPDTAQRRLDYWRQLDASIDAAKVVADVGGGDAPRFGSLELQNAFDGLISANIRFARAQLSIARSLGADQ